MTAKRQRKTSLDRRVITVIEEQRLVCLGSTALFTKVGQLHIQIIGKRSGEISYLYRHGIKVEE